MKEPLLKLTLEIEKNPMFDFLMLSGKNRDPLRVTEETFTTTKKQLDMWKQEPY